MLIKTGIWVLAILDPCVIRSTGCLVEPSSLSTEAHKIINRHHASNSEIIL